jgi:hypothetical protein
MTADSLEALGNSEAAQSYRNKADSIVTMYAVEQFELAMHGDKNAKQAPELRDYSYGDMPPELSDQMAWIFAALAEHCRCKIGWHGYARSKIVGYPSDLEYLDLMFTSIRMHMSANVRPQPSREMGYGPSLALLKESGMKWRDIYLRLLPIFPEEFVGTVADVSKQKKSSYNGLTDYQRDFQRHQEMGYEVDWFDSSLFQRDYIKVGDHIFVNEIPRSIGVRFTKQYTAFCDETGRDRVYSDPKVWVRSFVEGYSMQIRRRIRDMKASTEEATTGKELVLKSIYEDLLEFFYENFPERRPHPPGCDCEIHHSCNDPKCQRAACKARRKPVRYRSIPERKVSHAAMQRGVSAANTADLSGADRRVGSDSRKEIG